MKTLNRNRNLAAASLRAGQFQHRVIPDKKKTAHKYRCRGKNLQYQRAENGPKSGPFSLNFNGLFVYDGNVKVNGLDASFA
jgi:hypothetical protein